MFYCHICNVSTHSEHAPCEAMVSKNLIHPNMYVKSSFSRKKKTWRTFGEQGCFIVEPRRQLMEILASILFVKRTPLHPPMKPRLTGRFAPSSAKIFEQHLRFCAMQWSYVYGIHENELKQQLTLTCFITEWKQKTRYTDSLRNQKLFMFIFFIFIMKANSIWRRLQFVFHHIREDSWLFYTTWNIFLHSTVYTIQYMFHSTVEMMQHHCNVLVL